MPTLKFTVNRRAESVVLRNIFFFNEGDPESRHRAADLFVWFLTHTNWKTIDGYYDSNVPLWVIK